MHAGSPFYTIGHSTRSVAELRDLGRAHACAVLCAEAVWWRCHRRIITDYLLAGGDEVFHVMAPGKIERASMNPAAIQEHDGTLVYPGQEIRGHQRRLARRIRRHWPRTHITLRGGGHYGRPEVMAWCEAEGIDYVFGLSTNAALRAAVEEAADDVRVRRAEVQAPVLRRYAETRYGAKSWGKDRRVVARIEAGTPGLDIRFVVTSFARGSAGWVYDGLYCARGQHRLNRGGNRQANAVLHRVVVVRMRRHEPTLDYVRRRTVEGKSKAEIIRCLKRYVAREIFCRLRRSHDAAPSRQKAA